MVKNILIFPCGSEIALELKRALGFSVHFKLFGASSIHDHGEYVFENYIHGLPFVEDDDFIYVNNESENIKEIENESVFDKIDSPIVY